MSYKFNGTPGPWEMGSEDNGSAEIVLNDTIATVCRWSKYSDKYVIERDEMLANAYLIAAAPDILDCLVELLEQIDESNLDVVIDTDRARTAIEKALNYKK